MFRGHGVLTTTEKSVFRQIIHVTDVPMWRSKHQATLLHRRNLKLKLQQSINISTDTTAVKAELYPFDTHYYHMGTPLKHPVPDRLIGSYY